MTEDQADEIYDKAQNFQRDFRDLVHKYAGSDFRTANGLLLTLMQERTSVFNPYIWSSDKVQGDEPCTNS